jgi:hypothetical protein
VIGLRPGAAATKGRQLPQSSYLNEGIKRAQVIDGAAILSYGVFDLFGIRVSIDKGQAYLVGREVGLGHHRLFGAEVLQNLDDLPDVKACADYSRSPPGIVAWESDPREAAI